MSKTVKLGVVTPALAHGLLAYGPYAILPVAASSTTCSGVDKTTWSVPVGCVYATVTINGNKVVVDAAPPADATAGSFMALTVLQDGIGHPIIWGSHVGVDPTTAGDSNDLLEAPSIPNSQETYFLVWEPAPTSVWKIVARSRNRAESGATTQGNNEQLGLGNGNVGVTNAPAICSANRWTKYMSDDGGFQGFGVRDYLYNVAGETTICNPNSQTAFYSIVCRLGGYMGRVDGDHEIDGNQCIHIPYEAALPANSVYFMSFHCFINPTDSLLVWYTMNHSLEIPLD
jgi:hypothetical protein